jgi:hypothetical protein
MENARAALRMALMDGSIVPTEMLMPPQFVTDLGYQRLARYVSLFWAGDREAVVLDDGDAARDGNWEIYRTWVHHPYVLWSTRSSWNFGSDTGQQTHRWLIDQATATVFAGEERVILQLVQSQWPEALTRRPEHTAAQQIAHRDSTPSALHTADLMEALETRARRVRLLTAWLDEQWAGMMLRHPDRQPIFRHLIGPPVVLDGADSLATVWCN